MKKRTVAILGNHGVNYSTESHLAWSFEDLGHEVLRFQENEHSTEFIADHAGGIDLFVYIHTHGWRTPGKLPFYSMVNALKKGGAITCGFHLDIYWGLNIADERQDRIGFHDFWLMDYVFTADGGHQKEFAARGVNHFWMPPAVVKYGCFRGIFNPELAVDVAFVGQKNYHVEYPFRGQLIDWLEQTYGTRFRRYAGDTKWGLFREQRLNDLYASVKVCVGDSCFAGAIPNYWSDRVPETLGRGGFLLHPAVPGLNMMGVPTYRPQDFTDLKEKIDYYLSNDMERKLQSQMGFGWVRTNETYHNRIEKMLGIMGLL